MNVTLLPATKQMELLRAGRISAVELAEEHLCVIAALNPQLHALAEHDPERVREDARTVMEKRHTGPLAGLPVTVKSSIRVAGMRMEIGSRLRQGMRSDVDAEAVRRLRAAGAVVLGTTNCPELLMNYETDNLLYGRTANPWDLTRSAGGSSGGEAAAIAAGMSAGGIGSDSGGSVRQPAHFCGIAALKPTPGRVPGRGHEPPCVGPFASLGVVGPMARTVGDVRLLFEVLAGHDGLDPASVPVATRTVSTAELRRMTIGYLEDGGVPVTVETRSAMDEAVRVLRALGFELRPFSSGLLEEARRLWWTFFMQCGAMFYADTVRGREDELSPSFRDYLKAGRAGLPITGDELLQRWADADMLRARMLDAMREMPLLLTPVCSVPAFRHGERSWLIDGAEVGYWDAMRFTQWFNLLALPAAVVRAGTSNQGLPIGIQIAGLPFCDEEVLALGELVERELPFSSSLPPIASSLPLRPSRPLRPSLS